MVVKVSKPEINVREKISELDKPSGLAGQAMLAAETPQEQFNLIGAGRRNMIINGGFDVWQRGNTVNTTLYSADRWMQWMTNSGVSNRNVNCTKQTGGPIGRNSSYIRYAPQVVDTGMEKFSWGQKIEKVNLDHIESGQQLTLSFWIKREQSLPTDNNMDIQILYPDSTDGWSGIYLFRNDENIDQTLDSISFNSLSTEWTKYSYTFVPSNTVLDRGLAVYWHVGDTNFNLNNTNALISFTGVQLEVGKVATPFEQRSYGEELALCQRYLYSLTNNSTGYVCPFWQYNNTATINGWVKFPVTMRAEPSLVYNTQGQTNWVVGYGSGSGLSMDTFTLNEQTLDSAVLYNSQTNFGIGTAGGMYVASASAVIQFDAEL